MVKRKKAGSSLKILLVSSSIAGLGTVSYSQNAFASANNEQAAAVVQPPSSNTLTSNDESQKEVKKDQNSGQTDSSGGTQAVESYDLASLSIDQVKLNKDFSPDNTNYTAEVENGVKQVHLLLETKDSDTAITISSPEQEIKTAENPLVKNGIAADLPLKTGVNKFTIEVKIDNKIKSTYHLNVIREKSGDNYLQSMTFSEGTLTPAFRSAIFSYQVHVKANVESLDMQTEAEDPAASVKINGQIVKDSKFPIKVPAEKSTVHIQVTAENGKVREYTLLIIKDALKAEKPRTSTKTSSKTSKTPVKNPQKDKTGSKSMGNKQKGNSRNAAENSKAKDMYTNLVNTQSGSAAFSKNRQSKAAFMSTASGGNQYAGSKGTQGVTKAAASTAAGPQVKKSAAALSGLTVSAGTWNKRFSSTEYTYHIAETSSVDEVTINPTPSESGASVEIAGKTGRTISLGENKKTIIPIVVTKDDERKTYVLVFDKDIKQVKKTAAPPAENSDSNSVINTSSSIKSPSMETIGRNRMQQSRQSSWWDRFIQNIKAFFS